MYRVDTTTRWKPYVFPPAPVLLLRSRFLASVSSRKDATRPLFWSRLRFFERGGVPRGSLT